MRAGVDSWLTLSRFIEMAAIFRAFFASFVEDSLVQIAKKKAKYSKGKYGEGYALKSSFQVKINDSSEANFMQCSEMLNRAFE